MSDPTMDFVNRLNDRSQWVVREAVPLFEPHARFGTGADGKPVKIVVTENDLHDIAAEIRQLEDDRGFFGKITLGSHLFKVLPTGERVRVVPPPPLGGFFRNPRVGRYGPKQLPALLVDNYYFPEHAAEADKYPNRSADYYPGLNRITGMALLTVDPALPMGTVCYEGGQPCYQYSLGEGDMGETNAASRSVADLLDRVRGLREAIRADRLELYGGHAEGDPADETDPFATPAYHAAAVEYMMSKPGVQYGAAVAHVKARHAEQ